ncbi:MAG TPA: GTP cyclohydrolase II [Saprospiraceae bacterium]|nr:GTP cyclohydrolase II [Saprospiraceae bacterium]HPN69516.1 GTP cyclohydrolase II [Saprospiraceae bacterium]
MNDTIPDIKGNKFMQKDALVIQGEALIPTDWGPFTMKAYSRTHNDQMPHFALIQNPIDITKPVNVRIHSECITGDIFKSNRCECGEQLSKSMEYISKNGGVLIYLRQEGRGIGIINKLHAYEKQDQGFDTAEANTVLGFEVDARSYNDAIEILNDLNIKTLNLLTNNPDKIKAIEKGNIEVKKRIPLVIKAKKENQKYLDTKKNIFGHLLDN